MSIDDLPPAERVVVQGQRLNIGLRSIYARWLLFFMGLQIWGANLVFALYAINGVHWRIPANVMIGWLSATVVEVIGVVTVVTRSLFPTSE